MRYAKALLAIIVVAAAMLTTNASATLVTLDFENNTVIGGTLNLLESGSDPVTDFTGDRFDERSSADFEIQGISGVGSLGVNASAILDDLNVTGSGLQDGPSGYGASGEGTSFTFDLDVTITGLDWVSFTGGGSDSVTLINGGTNLGSFSEGTVSGGIDFSNTNPSTMNINVSAGDPFIIQYDGGNFFLGQMTLDVVPEPSAALLLLGSIGGTMLLRRRR